MAESELKVPYVQRSYKNGVLHLYFRKGGWREGPLKSHDNSQELLEEVNSILARLTKAQEAAKKPRANTVAGLLKIYNKSADYLMLARSTQAEYQHYIDDIIEDIGEHPLNEVTRAFIVDMRDAWAVRGHRAASNRMQVLKNALTPVIDDDADLRITGDPFRNIKKISKPHDSGEAHPIWLDEEVTAAIEGAIARNHNGLARAIALGRYGGFRRGTICEVPLHARITGYDSNGEAEQRLYWITEKRKVLCDKREDRRLTDLIKRTPSNAWTLSYNANGDKWKPRQLNQAFDRLMTALAKAGKVRKAQDEDGKIYCPLTLHGLRHSRGVELAQAGAPDSEIMAQLEHSTSRQAAEYRRQADRRKLADAGQDRIDNVRDLRLARAVQKSQSNGQ